METSALSEINIRVDAQDVGNLVRRQGIGEWAFSTPSQRSQIFKRQADTLRFSFDGALIWADEFNVDGKPNPTWNSTHTPVGKLGKNSDNDFHIWRMDWDKKSINKAGRGPSNPFPQPHYILLNLAIGGKAGGDPSKTAFPSRYEIDYVRVYQEKPSTKNK